MFCISIKISMPAFSSDFSQNCYANAKKPRIYVFFLAFKCSNDVVFRVEIIAILISFLWELFYQDIIK